MLLLLCKMAIAQFSVPDNEPVSGLASNGAMGRVYVNAGAKVYSLSQDLQQLDQLTLEGTEVSGMAVSYDGQWLVVCSLDSFCRVIDGSALNAAPNTTQENAIAGGTAGVAVFTDNGNTFYTGGVGTLDGDRHVFAQFGFAGNNLARLFNPRPAAADVTRVMYGGFYKSPYAYYVAVDTVTGGSGNQIRIVRVCNEAAMETIVFGAVYEVEMECGSVSVEQLAGVSLVNGVTLILGVTSSASSEVCLYNLSSIDNVMDSFFQDCLVGDMGLNSITIWMHGVMMGMVIHAIPTPNRYDLCYHKFIICTRDDTLISIHICRIACVILVNKVLLHQESLLLLLVTSQVLQLTWTQKCLALTPLC